MGGSQKVINLFGWGMNELLVVEGLKLGGRCPSPWQDLWLRVSVGGGRQCRVPLNPHPAFLSYRERKMGP